jgi:hypothetical protein
MFLLCSQKEGSIKNEYPNLKDQQGDGALTLYIKVENLEGLYQRIKNDVYTILKRCTKPFMELMSLQIQDSNSFIVTFSDVLE